MSVIYHIIDVISLWLEISLGIGLLISVITMLYYAIYRIRERIERDTDIDAEARQILEEYIDDREGRDAMR